MKSEIITPGTGKPGVQCQARAADSEGKESLVPSVPSWSKAHAFSSVAFVTWIRKREEGFALPPAFETTAWMKDWDTPDVVSSFQTTNKLSIYTLYVNFHHNSCPAFMELGTIW